MNKRIEQLRSNGVIIPAPEQICIDDDVLLENIEDGVTILPGVTIRGEKTLIGKESTIGPGGNYVNISCGRNVRLEDGYYSNCVFLDNAKVRSGAEIRGGTLFMDNSEAAHTVGCKMTILGIKVVLGSLINFCDIFISGGKDEPFGFTEIGSGAIHYNFSPNGLKFGSLIGPGAPGEMFGIFAKSFIGGQTQIIGPTIIGHQVLIPAGTAVRNKVPAETLYIEQTLKATAKKFEPNMLTSVKDKFLITAKLVSHYQALLTYFKEIRLSFAQLKNDLFLEKLYQEAINIIRMNIAERLDWLFNKKEGRESASFFKKLEKSINLHKNYLNKALDNKIVFHLKQIKEHQTLLLQEEQLYKTLQKESEEVTEQANFKQIGRAHV